MFQRRGEISQMSCVVRAAVLIRQVAEPRPVGDLVKAAINRAARRVEFKYSRAFEIWYERARRIDAHEMEALARYVEASEALRHAAAMDRAAMVLGAKNPHVYKQEIDQLRNVARLLRRENGAVTDEDY